MDQVPFEIAEGFLTCVKNLVLKICNTQLTMFLEKPSKPSDKFHVMAESLQEAEKTCSVALASLSDPEICMLLNEMLFVRLKSEDYFQQLTGHLHATQRHTIRKTVAEIQMKVQQVVTILRERFSCHVMQRIETTSLQAFAGQPWLHHKDNFTSSSWLDKFVKVVTPFQNSTYLDYIVPRNDMKRIVLSPSRGLTTWRLALITLRKDL